MAPHTCACCPGPPSAQPVLRAPGPRGKGWEATAMASWAGPSGPKGRSCSPFFLGPLGPPSQRAEQREEGMMDACPGDPSGSELSSSGTTTAARGRAPPRPLRVSAALPGTAHVFGERGASGDRLRQPARGSACGLGPLGGGDSDPPCACSFTGVWVHLTRQGLRPLP